MKQVVSRENGRSGGTKVVQATLEKFVVKAAGVEHGIEVISFKDGKYYSIFVCHENSR